MGGDGGTAPSGRFIVKTKERKLTAADITQGLSKLERWQTCAMSGQKLKPPLACCGIGNLYNKEHVVERLLIEEELPPPFHHIQRLKDLINVNVQFKNGKDGMIICPFSQDEADGNTRFVCVRKCGCVFSRKAMDSIDSKVCLVCGKALPSERDDWVLIPLLTTEKTQDELRKLVEKKSKRKKKKKKKKGVKTTGLYEGYESQTSVKLRALDAELEKKKKTNPLYKKLFTSSLKPSKRPKYYFGAGGPGM